MGGQSVAHILQCGEVDMRLDTVLVGCAVPGCDEISERTRHEGPPTPSPSLSSPPFHHYPHPPPTHTHPHPTHTHFTSIPTFTHTHLHADLVTWFRGAPGFIVCYGPVSGDSEKPSYTQL